MYETLEKNLKNYNSILQRKINAAKNFAMNQNSTSMYQI